LLNPLQYITGGSEFKKCNTGLIFTWQ